MNPSFRSLWIVAFAVLTIACSEDDPLPLATVDFKTDPAVVEVGLPVMFDNLSLNADRYEWQVGTEVLTDISPEIIFSTPGNFEIVLRAFTKDNQVDSIVKTVSVKQRYLTDYLVKSFPKDSLDFDWDKDEVLDEDKLPDVLVVISVNKSSPTAEEIENSVLGPIFLNASNQDVSNTVSNNVILTNESWYIALSDWDGLDPDAISLQNDPFSDMVFATFNPVQAPSIKSADGLAGYFSLTGLDADDNFIDIDFFFELR